MSDYNEKVSELADCLLRVEAEMRRSGVWSDTAPSEEALASSQPFCLDTLVFTEWLQFVFLAKMKVMVESNSALPSVSGIAPMAEEHFRVRTASAGRLIQELTVIDGLLSES